MEDAPRLTRPANCIRPRCRQYSARGIGSSNEGRRSGGSERGERVRRRSGWKSCTVASPGQAIRPGVFCAQANEAAEGVTRLPLPIGLMVSVMPARFSPAFEKRPSGAKAPSFVGVCGTTEVGHFHDAIYATGAIYAISCTVLLLAIGCTVCCYRLELECACWRSSSRPASRSRSSSRSCSTPVS